MKKVFAITFLIVISSVTYLFCFYRYGGEEEIHLLPENFKGNVVIIFDQPNGQKKKYEGGKRVYDIPNNGILITQFSPNSGWHPVSRYYYVNDHTDRKELVYLLTIRPMSEDTVYVWASSFGTTAITSNIKKPVSFSIYSVGTKSEKDSLDKARENIYPPSLLKN